MCGLCFSRSLRVRIVRSCAVVPCDNEQRDYERFGAPAQTRRLRMRALEKYGGCRRLMGAHF
jgi:hypothetical protein